MPGKRSRGASSDLDAEYFHDFLCCWVRKATDKEEEDSGKTGCVLEGPRIRKLLMKVTGKRIHTNTPNTTTAIATLFGKKQKNSKLNKLEKVDARLVNDPKHAKPNVYSYTKRQDKKCVTSYAGLVLRDSVIRAWENENNTRHPVYDLMMQGLLPKYKQCSMLSIYQELGKEADDSDEEDDEEEEEEDEEVATPMTPKTPTTPRTQKTPTTPRTPKTQDTKRRRTTGATPAAPAYTFPNLAKTKNTTNMMHCVAVEGVFKTCSVKVSDRDVTLKLQRDFGEESSCPPGEYIKHYSLPRSWDSSVAPKCVPWMGVFFEVRVALLPPVDVSITCDFSMETLMSPDVVSQVDSLLGGTAAEGTAEEGPGGDEDVHPVSEPITISQNEIG